MLIEKQMSRFRSEIHPCLVSDTSILHIRPFPGRFRHRLQNPASLSEDERELERNSRCQISLIRRYLTFNTSKGNRAEADIAPPREADTTSLAIVSLRDIVIIGSFNKSSKMKR